MRETPPNILEYAPAQRTSAPPAAWALIVGGAIVFVAPLAVANYADALFIDFVPLLLIGLGFGLRRGSRPVAAWALALTTAYGLGCVFALAHVALPSPFLARPMSARALRLTVSSLDIAWSVVTAYLLTRVLWPPSYAATARPRRRVLLLVGTLYLFATGGLVLRHWIRFQAAQRAPQMTTDVTTVDADTGQPLRVRVGGPSIGEEDPWGLMFTALAADRMRLNWEASKPLPVLVSSPGYAEQTVILDAGAAPTTVVRLRRAQPPTTAP